MQHSSKNASWRRLQNADTTQINVLLPRNQPSSDGLKCDGIDLILYWIEAQVWLLYWQFDNYCICYIIIVIIIIIIII